jgi:predicted transcriptional regulator
MPVMAKNSKDKPKDQHRSTNMVRLPDDIHRAMKGLAQANGRPLTWEVRQALMAWLQAKGQWPPTP